MFSLFFHLWQSRPKLLVMASLGLLSLQWLNGAAADVIKEAEALFIEGSVDASVALLESLDLESHPQALVMLASIYCNTAEWQKLDALAKEMKDIPYLSDLSHYFSGRIALANNRLGSARRAFEQATKERPSGTQFILGHLYFYQAICLAKLKQAEQAREAYENALMNGFVAESLEEIVQLAQFHALFTDAQTTISYINSYPKSLLKEDARVGAILGRAYLNKDLKLMAIKSFTQSLALDSEQASILALRANAYRMCRNYKAGFADIQAAIALAPELIELNYILGLLHFEMGELKPANTAFHKIYPHLQNNNDFLILCAQLAYTVDSVSFSKQALQRYFKVAGDLAHINAHYLSFLLKGSDVSEGLNKPNSSDWAFFLNYANGKNSADYILANTKSASLAFFMAQVAKAKNDETTEKRLLEATLKRAEKNSPEYLSADWLLKGLEN